MSIRTRRVADEIRSVVSDLLTRKLQDPRLDGVRISEVRITPDLRHATLLFSVFPADDSDRDAARRALVRASGLLRRELGRRLRLKVIPELEFRADLAPAYAEHIDRVLAEVQPPPIDDDGDQDDPGAP